MADDTKRDMTEDEFRGLCIEVMPHIRGIMKILKKRDVKELATLSVSADGYFNFCPHDTEWEMTCIAGSHSPRLKYERSVNFFQDDAEGNNG